MLGKISRQIYNFIMGRTQQKVVVNKLTYEKVTILSTVPQVIILGLTAFYHDDRRHKFQN